MHYDKIRINGINIFYRESGDKSKPALVLLHGFPSASRMFRDLIPMLDDEFHIVSPDYPGFGQSDAPGSDEFSYTFENIAEHMDKFLSAVRINEFFMYVFDYGAPIGFRLANRHPGRILGIISQNGNVYEEGLGSKWTLRKAYWQNPTPWQRKQLESAFAPETIIDQYTFGTEKWTVSPDGYSLSYVARTCCIRSSKSKNKRSRMRDHPILFRNQREPFHILFRNAFLLPRMRDRLQTPPT